MSKAETLAAIFLAQFDQGSTAGQMKVDIPDDLKELITNYQQHVKSQGGRHQSGPRVLIRLAAYGAKQLQNEMQDD
jgi:hypothetical protein